MLYVTVTFRLVGWMFLQEHKGILYGPVHGWLQALAPAVNFGRGSCQLQLKSYNSQVTLTST